MRSFWSLIASHRLLFMAGQGAMLVAAAAGLAFPWTVRDLFDGVLASGSSERLIVSILLLGVVLIGREVAEYLKRWLLGRASEGIVHTLRERVYDGLLTRSLGFFHHRSSGEIVSVASNDISAVQAGITSVLTNLVQQVVVLCVVVSMLFVLDPLLASVVAFFVPPLVLVSRIMARRSARTTARRQQLLGEIMSIVQQSVAGIEVIRSFLLEGVAAQMHREHNDRSLETSVQGVTIGASSAFWSGTLGSLFMLTIMGFGGYRVISGSITAPDLIAFILYAEMITGPFVHLASLVPEIAKTRVAFDRIRSLLENDAIDPILLETTSDVTGRHGNAERTLDSLTCSGAIRFESVSFAYDGIHNVLQDVSFETKPGETVALVGPSGAGKSTIARLIPRLYDPGAGSISIDGVDIRSIPIERLRASVGVVSQEPFIFGMSIEDNIRCGAPDASEADLMHAARLAYADEFIRKLPDGYQTFVGEGGAKLSGGQRQRVAIARAFLKSPPILLLDEATSALDGLSEEVVRRALDALRAGRTTFVIAHRLETIRSADAILVLDEGRIVDSGSHAELISRGGLYAELYRAAAERTQRVRGDHVCIDTEAATAGKADGLPSSL